VPRLFRWLARPPSRLENYLRIYLAAESFRLLADPTRIKILWVLLQGESSVASLAELVGAAPTAVSQHSRSCASPASCAGDADRAEVGTAPN